MNSAFKKFLSDNKIELVSSKKIAEVVEDFSNDERNHQPAGNLLCKEDNVWTVCDDSCGSAYVENFKHLHIALLYLTTDMDVDELHEFDKVEE